MMNPDALSQYDIPPETHFNPNEKHPAELALLDILDNVKLAIQGSSNLPKYMDGGLISVPLTTEQLSAIQAQVRTLRMIEKMIIERYPGVIE